MKKLLIAILVGSLAVVSCTKSLNINNNPNQPTSVTPNVVLSAALLAGILVTKRKLCPGCSDRDVQYCQRLYQH